jgi:ASC-1-like (ASCH) protein
MEASLNDNFFFVVKKGKKAVEKKVVEKKAPAKKAAPKKAS